MASLINALTAVPTARMVNMPVANPQVELDIARHGSELGKGLARGVSGVSTGLQAAVGQVVQPFSPDTGTNIISDAQAEATRVHHLYAPEVASYKDVHDLSSAGSYAAGKAAEMIPALPLMYAGGLAGRAIGGAAGAQIGGAASFAPQMMGAEAMHLNQDEAAKNLTPWQKALYSAGVGTAGAAAMAAVPAAMGGSLLAPEARSLAQTMLTRPVVNTVGGGAGMAAGDVISQGAQKLYNPDKQIDWEQTKEAGIGGMVAMAPLAGAHAIPETLLSGGAHGVKAAGDAVGKARDALSEVPKTLEEAVAARDQAQAEHAEVSAAHEQAAASPDTNMQKAAATMGDRASLAYEHAKLAGERVQDFVEEKLGQALDALGGSRDVAPEKTIEKLSDLIRDNYKPASKAEQSMRDPGLLSALKEKLNDWMVKEQVTPEEMAQVMPALEKLKTGAQLTAPEAMNLWIGAKRLSQDYVRPREEFFSEMEKLNDFMGGKVPTKKEMEGAKFSRQSDKRARSAFTAMKDAMLKGGIAPPAKNKGPSEAFKNGVTEIVNEMVEGGHPALKDATTRQLTAESIASFMHNLARGAVAEGQSYNGNAEGFSHLLRKFFGNGADAGIEKMQRLVGLEYGAESKQSGRMELLSDSEASLGKVAQALEPYLGKKLSGDDRSGTSKFVSAFVSALRDAQAEDLRPNQASSLYKSAKSFTEQANAIRETNPTKAAELDVKAKSAQAKANAELGRTKGSAVAELRKNLVGKGFIREQLEGDKGDVFETVAEIIGQADVKLNKFKTEKEKAQGNNAAKPVADREDSNSYSAQQRAAEGAERMSKGEIDQEQYEAILESNRQEFGIDGVVEDRKYYGTNVFNPIQRGTITRSGKEVTVGGHEIGAPVSRYPSADYTSKKYGTRSEYEAALELAEQESGFRVSSVKDMTVAAWARDMAASTNRSEHELMQEAMDALLLHDKQRLEKSGHKLTGKDKEAIAIRQSLAGESPENFWNHPFTQHHRYLRFTQNDASNLSFTPESLSRMGMRHPDFYTHGLDRTPELYARRIEERDDGAFSSYKPYTDALIPVEVGSGTPLQVDVARLVDGTMRRHQTADVGGVMTENKAQQVLQAFMEVMGAVLTAKGVKSIGRTHETAERARSDMVNFDPDLVIHREVTHHRDGSKPDGKVWTYGQLTGLLGVDSHTGMRLKEGVLLLEGVTKPLKNEQGVIVKEGGEKFIGRKEIATTAEGNELNAFVLPVFAKAKDVPGAVPKNLGTGADGRATGVVTTAEGLSRTLDMQGMLRQLLERNGVDARAVTEKGNLPNAYAATLMRQMIGRMEDLGYKIEHGDRLDRTVVFKREFDGEVKDVTWGDLKGLKETSVNFEQARLQHKADMLAKATAELTEAMSDVAVAAENNRGKTGDVKGTPRDIERQLTLEEAKETANKKEVGKDWDDYGFSDITVNDKGALVFRNEKSRDTLDDRLAALAKELGMKKEDVPVFDRSVEAGGEAPSNEKGAGIGGSAPDSGALNARSQRRREFVEQNSKKSAGALQRDALAREEGEGQPDPVKAAEVKAFMEEMAKKLEEHERTFKEWKPKDNSKIDGSMPKQLAEPMDAPATPEAPITGRKVMQVGEPPAKPAWKTNAQLKEEARAAKAAADFNEAYRALETKSPRAEPEKMKLELDTPVLDWMKAGMRVAKEASASKEVEGSRNEPVKADVNVPELASRLAAQKNRMSIKDAAELIESLNTKKQSELLSRLVEGNSPAGNQIEKILSQRGVKYSKMEGSRDGPRTVEEYQAEHKRLVGDVFKATTEVTKDLDGGNASGLYIERVSKSKDVQEASAKIMLDLARGDMGTLRHETWHHIEALLKGMGEHGKHVIDIVHKGVSTPMMESWLKTELAKHESALDQLKDPSERAAFGFQMFLKNGGKMPLSSEVRNVWQRLGDWIMAKLNITSSQKKMENFFEYINKEGFARDIENPEAVLRGMKETAPDQFVRKMSESLEPLREVAKTLLMSGDSRVRQHNIEEYNTLMDKYAGVGGKIGFQGERHRMYYKWGNLFAEKMKNVPEEMRSFKSVEEDMAKFGKYVTDALTAGGMEPREALRASARMQDRVDGYNKTLADKHFKELVNDIINHGGLPTGDKAGLAQDIATSIADKGYYFDPELKLFKDAPQVQAKWLSKDPMDKLIAWVSKGTEIAERTRAFGEVTKEAPYGTKFHEMLAKGDAKATKQGQQDMQEFIKGWEHAYENSMSDGLKKLVGGIQLFENVRLLPLAVFSQALEPMQLAFRKNSFDGIMETTWRGVKNLPRAFDWAEKHYTPDYWENLAMQIGTAQSRVLNGAVGHMVNGMKLRGNIGWLNDKFFQYNFMDTWNRSMHIEATKHAVEFLRDHANGVDKVHSERFLKELNLKASDVKFKDGKLELTDKTEHAIVQFVNEAMAHPDAGSNPFWMNDPRFALIAQMKRFTFAHSKFILDRGVKEWEKGNTWVLAPAVLAMPWMLAADGIRDTLTGKDMAYRNNWGVSDYTLHAFERAGHAGKSQFGADIWHDVKMGGSGFGSVLGPAAQSFGDILRGTNNGHMIDALIGGSPVHQLVPG